jgi:hypothetical protein
MALPSTVEATGSASVLRVGDIEVFGRIVMTQASVLVTLGVGILVLAPAAMKCAHRLGWSRARIASAGVAGASLALVPATTLARGDTLIAWGRSCVMQPGLSLGTPEAALNALLFAPAAFFAVLAVRRAVGVVLSVLACSAAVEVIQSVTALGTCQTADVVRNVAGATVACGVAALLLRVLDPASATDQEPVMGR